MNKIFKFFALTLTGMIVFFVFPAQASITNIVINEIRIDQSGADNDEYFELSGEAGTSLNGYTYLVIGDSFSGSGVIEAVVDLTGQSIPSSGYFVAAESTFTLATADLTTALNFENSDNVTHLLVDGFSGANGDDLDTDDDGVLDSTPWTAVLDRVALIEENNPPSFTEYHYGPPAVGPDGSFVPGHVFRCGTNWEIGSFSLPGGDDTPGAINSCPNFDSDGDGVMDNDEGTGDRDGDGFANYNDYDPTGYFYDETTGEIIPGGFIAVSGPPSMTATILEDGSSGYYQFTINSPVPSGIYEIIVTLPPGYEWSQSCFDQGTFDPTGQPNPTVLGNGEDGNTGFLTSNECTDFYLRFELQESDPFIFNNNFPLRRFVTPIPTLSEWGMIIMFLILAGSALWMMRRRQV